LVPQTPASIEANEYTKLLRNILKFNKNVVITANFHSFASQLIVSDQIQEDFARQNGDVEMLSTPNHSPQRSHTSNTGSDASSKSSKKEHGKMETMISIPGDDAFLSRTVHHDVVQNASVPAMREEAQWIDVWLFASDYTFNFSNIQNNHRDDTFPMLMCQLAHILVQNKVWVKKAHAKWRILFMANNQWDQQDRANFDAIMQQLRLTDIEVQHLNEPENYKKPKWQSIVEEKRKGTHLKKYYNSLNSIIKSHSAETYFTFLALPELPPIVDGDEEMTSRLNLMYYQSLYVLLRGLPPTALVATGEEKPVISIDL